MDLRAIDMNLLVVLDALLQESSITRAGERIGLSQSATSHALARLRSLLEDPLLVRTPGGMAPTARARLIAAPIREALDQVEKALVPPRPFDPSHSTRSFTLCLEDAGQVGLLPMLAERLRAEAPDVKLRVRSASGSLVDALVQGSVDLALAVSPPPTSGLHTEVVFATPYVSIVRTGHPDVPKRLTLPCFTRLRHIVLDGPGGVENEIDRALTDRARERQIALAVPSLLPIPALVARSDLIATVPALLLGLDRHRPNVTRHPPPVPLEAVTGSLVWHQRNHEDAAQRWLRRVLREACRELASGRP